MANQAQPISANTSRAAKVARQPPISTISWPTAGATVGTRMNTAITIDRMRAMARPEWPSRTIASVTILGAEAPTPCRARPTSSIVKLVASTDSAQPSTKIANPACMIGRRPKRSDRGPANS